MSYSSELSLTWKSCFEDDRTSDFISLLANLTADVDWPLYVDTLKYSPKQGYSTILINWRGLGRVAESRGMISLGYGAIWRLGNSRNFSHPSPNSPDLERGGRYL